MIDLVKELRKINLKHKIDENIKLKIIDNEGKVFKAPFYGCTQALDNEPEIASIELKMDGYILSLYENEIKSIEVI